MKWIKRLTTHGKKLQGFGLPVALIGDFNIMPTDLDTYKTEKYADNALFVRKPGNYGGPCSKQDGQMPSASCIPTNVFIPFGITCVTLLRD
ncbi:hypothetical protein [Mucilaginibacter endophyticus]|uniref:hypothetical protein n=1 Tax=Mucilaginibacter endophyticus TaxID=2675003 RepID=UPI0031345E06